MDKPTGQPPFYHHVTQSNVVKRGVGFGSAMAIAVSFVTHQSIFWAIVHGLFSWLYILYFLITRP